MAGGKRLEALLEQITEALRDLGRRMDRLENQSAMAVASPRPRFVPGTLASLPEHLRRSMETIVVSGQATAEEVAEQTGRSRAAESDYLNQLVDRGFLRKERVGKEIVFQVFTLLAVCPMCGNRVSVNAKYCNVCGSSLLGTEQVTAKQVRGRL